MTDVTIGPGALLGEEPAVLRERGPAGIAATAGDDWLPLSLGQEQLYRLPSDGVEHHSVIAFRLHGELRVTALTEAIRQLVARHEPLRTTYAVVDGRPSQKVWSAAPVEPELADLEPLPEAAREPQLDARIREVVTAPFDLARGPVLRVLLARLTATEHVLVLCLHQIAADRWSKDVITAELGELYAAAVAGRPSRLPELRARYADHAAWQRKRFTDAKLNSRLKCWRERLADLPVLRLPTDRPRPGVRTATGALHEFRVPADVVRGLADLAQEGGSTLFSGLFTACQVLFSRYSQQQDLALGTMATGRPRQELDGLVGHFANPLVLRGTVLPQTPFTQLLAKNTLTVLDAFSHQDVPYERLVDELGDRGDGGRQPLVQAMVLLRDAFGETAELPGLSLREFHPSGVPSAYDVTVEFTETSAGDIAGVLEYDTALFDATTMQRLARHLVVLLTAAVADPSRPVGDLPLLDEEERRIVTADWAVNRAEFPADRGVHELVGEQARARPHAVAVVDGSTTVTYAELDTRANRLANLLASAGVRPGSFVAVCLPRGPELFAALLGVLRAGCAYLPLDPEYPSDRLSFMLADAEAAVCLTERRLTGRLPATDVRMICLDEQQEALAAHSAEPPRIPVSARDAAYVIYTSGSTGKPKGTVIEHRSITRLVCNADYVALREDDIVGQGADATFDAATFEIWAPLVAGAGLVVIDKHTLLDPAALIGALTRHRITTLFLTTAVFNQVVAADPSAFRTLRHLLFGGEAVNSSRVAQVLAAEPPQRLLHVYGPTETTTYATWHLVREADENAAVPIGGPLANTTVYVLDEQLAPVPIGVVGELYIAGPGVARGYLNRPELTAERFLDNPLGEAPDDRLYRTGDLVRWTPDGAIEYVGRVDHQVKVRGYRIEPSEIELVLAQHPGIEAAFVMAVEDDGQNKRLVGYVRPAAGQQPEAAELRDFVAARLPEFMVPSAFVPLAEFPLTPNGKIDRRALPAPQHTADTDSGLEPRTDTERALAGIWADVLGLPQVGITDNFYELGGDSILGIMVVAKAKKAGLPISAKDVFRRQTIAELAAVVADQA
ncbi:non-ribosomal peptide synthetase (plasmid) [Streptomyces lunaelactis]|uniref:Non-ribosomal peptide synthetase n=1 Tax=Streptomyces lunaelactis TaxID=1535768 RepID=A0A1J0R3D9_9ACTN|nr:non-ribosomal peptide synthetase [Streptomyces lunaelactis]APD72011.1 non-ribosomal peptide synthetase 3 [Streptomyces lunaelactis]AVZ77917.1 non-ribosomal peptide synthetase [Streptomyces lunaelactis]NUK83422.1 non-ribosomal peptide synthetase [Streptomyces lunaelactis]